VFGAGGFGANRERAAAAVKTVATTPARTVPGNPNARVRGTATAATTVAIIMTGM
jgi:hypothetical protein